MVESAIATLIAGSCPPAANFYYSSQHLQRLVSGASAFHSRLSMTVWTDLPADDLLSRCFCTLLLALDPTIEITKVVESVPYGRDDFQVSDIANTLANLGFDARSANIKLRDIDRRLLPCLFLARDHATQRRKAFVVLANDVSIGAPNTFLVFDGSTGLAHEIDAGDALASLSGTAYFFTKFATDEEMPANSRFKEPSWMRSLSWRFVPTFRWLLVLGIILNIVALATPICVMIIYDRVVSPHQINPLPMLLAGASLAAFIEWRLRRLRANTLAWLSARLDYVVGSAIFERLLLLSPSFVERASVSAQIARVKTFESVRDFFSGPVFLAVLELPTVFIALFAIAFLAGALVFVPICIAIAYLVLFYCVRIPIRSTMRDAAKKSSATQQFTIETLEKIEAIKTCGLEKIWAQKYRELSGREHVALSRLYFLSSIGETLGNSLAIIAAISTLSLGVQMIWDNAISTGVLIATMSLVWRVLTPFYSLCQMVARFEQTYNSLGQINELMDLEPETKGETASMRIPLLEGAISLRNVALRYAKDAGPVFYGLNLNIRAGEIVAIRGASGSGKSSILKVVQGLYAQQSGSIFIDNLDIRQFSARDLRRFIAYVPENPHLFSGTIAENLRLVRPLATDREIWQSLQQAGVAHQVSQLSLSINTRADSPEFIALDMLAVHRLSLARALLHPSTILLIDEVPSALLAAGLADTLGTLITDARGKRTVLLVTNREDHTRLANTVVTMRAGAVPAVRYSDKALELVA